MLTYYKKDTRTTRIVNVYLQSTTGAGAILKKRHRAGAML